MKRSPDNTNRLRESREEALTKFVRIAWVLIFTPFLLGFNQGNSGSGHWSGREPDFREMNLEWLATQVNAGRDRKQRMTVGDIERSFVYVFHNRLATQNFVARPRPRTIVRQIETLVRGNQKLAELLLEGRKSVARRDIAGQRTVLNSAEETAGEMTEILRDYFLPAAPLETVNLTLLPEGVAAKGHFVQFLLEAARIQKRLDHQLRNYFFDPTPAALTLSDYEASVPLANLTKAIQELSVLTRDRLNRR